MCVVVIDACRSEIDGSECKDPFPKALEPRGNGRPEVWALCVAAARSKAAYTSPPAVSDLSAFTHHFISEECGIFEPNVPFKRALELVCERVRLSNARQKQDPTILGLERIPDHVCLWPETPATQKFDVCICYNEEADKPLAKIIRDQLLLTGKCSEGIFLEPETGGRNREAQFANALCNSCIIAFVVSNHSFDGILDLAHDAPCESHLSRLLLKYEMALEIVEHRPDTQILPIVCHEDKSSGRFGDIDCATCCFSDSWLATLNSSVKHSRIAVQARRLLRKFDGDLAGKLHNKALQCIDGHSIPSLIKGRRLKETMQAISTLPGWKIEAMPKDAAVKLLVEHFLTTLTRKKRLQRDMQEIKFPSKKQKEDNVHRTYSSEMQYTTDGSTSGEPSSKKRTVYGGLAGESSASSASIQHCSREGSLLPSKRPKLDSCSEEGASSRAHGGSAETGGGLSLTAHAMISFLDEIRAKSFNIVLPLIDNSSDHFDLMISYRVNTEHVTAARMYDKILLTPSPDLAQMGDARRKIPQYARADSHNGSLNPGIARTFLDQKHIPQGMEWEQVFVKAVSNSLVLVPLLSWYEEDGEQPSGSVGELMSLYHDDRVDHFLLEIIIANTLMQLPAGRRWLQHISPIFIGKPDARGYTEFPFANIDRLPNEPSLRTCKKAADILMDDLKIPVNATVMAFSVKEHIHRITQRQGVKLSNLGQEDIALQSASTKLIKQIPALQQTRLKEMESMLPIELHLVASQMSSSRESSPTSSVMSGMDTPPSSPAPSQEILALHIESDVREFRDDMKKFMQDFCLDSSEQHREWRLCELLLVAFVRNMVAPSCNDSEAIGDLKYWQGKCNTPTASLMQHFDEMLKDLDPKPAIFDKIMDKYQDAVAGKQGQLFLTSVFAIDWMVQHSAWSLDGKGPKREWCKDVVMQWFDTANEGSAEIFVERAEIFLRKSVNGVHGKKWGVTILDKVIQTNSYVVFVRMHALWALLVREHCDLHKTGDTHQQMQVDVPDPATKKLYVLPIPITLIVSSSNWHISFAECEIPSSARRFEIAWRLRRIACMSSQLLEENECSMHKVDFVECEPLNNLQMTEKVEALPVSFSASHAASGGAAISSELPSAKKNCRHAELLELFNDNIEMVQTYLTDFSERFGQYEDAASGNKIAIDQKCIFVKTLLSELDPDLNVYNGSVPAPLHNEGHSQSAAGCTQNPDTLRERIQQIESSQRKGAEGEEERRMFFRRMGYAVGAGPIVHDVHSKVIDSANKFLHMLLKGHFLCLLGPPACGKTINMLQVACAAAASVQKCVDGGVLQETLPPRIPLFMRAAELSTLVSSATQQVRSLEALVQLFIAHKYPHAKYPNISGVLTEFLKLRRVLIFIDGLDEASGYRMMMENFIDQTASANDVCLMISTRDYAFEISRLEDRLREFESVKILPFDEGQRNRLIGRRLPDSGEAANFIAQFETVSQQTPEMATSPFLLALMIEVFKKGGKHTIPTKRCDLYDKQVDGILVRHECFSHLAARRAVARMSNISCSNVPTLHDLTAHMIFHDTEHSLYKTAKSDFRCLEALRKSLCANRGDDMDVDADSLEPLNVVSLREFLEVLAFVCQMRLQRRDFKWDSEEMQTQMQIMWRHSEFSLTVVSRFLLDLSSVGLLSKVGDGEFRFSHLTLQEYLAASCAVRLFGNDPQNLLDELNPLHSRWNREVVQFAACMPQLQDEAFEGFCQLVLQSDDGTGAHCELVQDFLKERAGSAAVQQKVRARLHAIRGVDSLIAGLCHPSLELRCRVLSEIKKFGVPPDPFALTDGIVTELKRIAHHNGVIWYTRAAAISSMVQIAQMDRSQQGDGSDEAVMLQGRQNHDRSETLRWLLGMLEYCMDENVHYALTKGLGTLLKGETPTTNDGDWMPLCQIDEKVVLYALETSDSQRLWTL